MELPELSRSRVRATDHQPRRSVRRPDGAWFIDFGFARFATLRGPVPATVTVELGEVYADPAGIRSDPGGSRRYRRLVWPAGSELLVIPPDQRNTTPPAVLVPPGLPEVLPFRYAVIHDWPGSAGNPGEVLMQRALAYPFRRAGSWRCSSQVLERVDALCRHTMEATSFLGIYVDGDRERIAYEGDALINQLGHAAIDADPTMAAATIEHLLAYPTWPAEWHLQLVCCAWEYLLASGDLDFWRRHAVALEARGLGALIGEDGWCSIEPAAQTLQFLASIARTEPITPVIDWPKPERDGCEPGPRTTVVNSWVVRANRHLADAFALCGLSAASERCAWHAERAREAILKRCWDESAGRFRDAPDSTHTSLHASLFPLACGVLDDDGDPRGKRAAEWLASRGMACSVYAAQHLIEALFRYGQDAAAHRLLASTGKRSWSGMLAQGSTMCMEAWSDADKPNQDWNHAWGGAPANLLPRWIAGVRPTAPGWSEAVVAPRPGPLQWFTCRVPTPHGDITVGWDTSRPAAERLRVHAPAAIRLTRIPPP